MAGGLYVFGFIVGGGIDAGVWFKAVTLMGCASGWVEADGLGVWGGEPVSL